MKVLALEYSLRLHEVHSLKEKRSIRRSLLAKIRNVFSASCAETDSQDSLGFLTIGVAFVSNDYVFLQKQEQALQDFLDRQVEFEVIKEERIFL